MTSMEREVGKLEARMETVEAEIHAIRQDVREIRDAMVGVKGGWRIFSLSMALATSFGAVIGQYAPFWLGQRP